MIKSFDTGSFGFRCGEVEGGVVEGREIAEGENEEEEEEEEEELEEEEEEEEEEKMVVERAERCCL